MQVKLYITTYSVDKHIGVQKDWLAAAGLFFFFFFELIIT